MEILGHHVPMLALDGGVSLVIAVAVVAAKAAFLERRPGTIVPSEIPPEAALSAPRSTLSNESLVHARAIVLDALYRASLECEDALRASPALAEEVFESCERFVAALRRRRPWLPVSLAERAEEFARGYERAADGLRDESPSNHEALAAAAASLRRALEAEFRVASGSGRR